MLTVDVDLADAEKVNEKFTEEDFDEELGSPTEVKVYQVRQNKVAP